MRVQFGLAARAALVLISGSAIPAAIPDPVKISSGLISGVTLKSGVRAFKGIPFAAPPVGPLRWREPQPPEPWSGIREAAGFGNVCMQQRAPKRVPVNVAVDLADSPKMSEDCLYLNVWTSAGRAGARLPVMIWIYGGAYREGAGSSPHNDGEALARKGVVLVTFNYRLGPFGFFSHPELTKESGRNASGNQALMDTIAVLKWAQSNIPAFGGDPKNVTVFGESAGAAMIGGLVGSPVAKGLFHRAIAESGQWMGLGLAPMIPLARAEQGAPAGRGPQTGVPAAEPRPLPPLSDLRSRSSDEVIETLRGSGMMIDGWVVPEDESITFAQGRQNPVDLIVGSNKDEHLAFGGQCGVPGHRDVGGAPLRRAPGGNRTTRVLVLLHARAAGRAWGPRFEGNSRDGNSVRLKQSLCASVNSGCELPAAGVGIGARSRTGGEDFVLLGQLREDRGPERQKPSHLATLPGSRSTALRPRRDGGDSQLRRPECV